MAPPHPFLPDSFLEKWQRLIPLLAQAADADAALVQAEGSNLVMRAAAERDPDHASTACGGAPLVVTTGDYAAAVIARGEPLVTEDASNDPAWRESAAAAAGGAAAAGVPLRWPDGVIFGAVMIIRGIPEHFTARQLGQLSAFGEAVDHDLAMLTAVSDPQAGAIPHGNQGGDTSGDADERIRRSRDALAEAERKSRKYAEELIVVNEDLRRANEQLREVDKLKNDFLAAVSHELRTPLATIQGGVDSLLDGMAGRVTEVQQRMLDIVRRNVQRLTRLIENLLEISRLNAGRFSVVRTRLDLREPVRHALAGFTVAAESGGIRLRGTLPEEEVLVDVDGDRMGQVVGNLLDNCMRYARKEVSARLEIEGAYALLIVEDDGPGVPSEKLPRLFQRFSRLGEDSSKSHMGLGLSIVRAIAEAHGGDAIAQNRPSPEQGLRFIVRIPVGVPSTFEI